MKKQIKLLKNNGNRDWSDLEWIQEFHDFLMGNIPESITLPEERKVKLTPEQSGAVIWYLREHFSIFPDNIEMCDNCTNIYDSDSEGCYYELERMHYCGGCEHLSDAVYCDRCMDDVWRDEALTEEGEYLCDECKKEREAKKNNKQLNNKTL